MQQRTSVFGETQAGEARRMLKQPIAGQLHLPADRGMRRCSRPAICRLQNSRLCSNLCLGSMQEKNE